MKKQLFLVVLVASLFAGNTAIAQFSNSSKKKAAPVAAPKDTTVKEVVTAPTSTPTTPNTPTIDPNIKATKIVDTSVVGGFNSKAKKSLRNNYAFASESKSRKSINERVPLAYQALREEDALYSEFVWEEIDGREKNQSSLHLPSL